jgi:hypothetical protein
MQQIENITDSENNINKVPVQHCKLLKSLCISVINLGNPIIPKIAKISKAK